MAAVAPSRRYRHRILIERPIADESIDGAGSGTWEKVDEVWCDVQDVRPSRAGEKLAAGMTIATRPARVLIRFREDITPDMRFVMGERIMQIVAGPAEIGWREESEFMVEDYAPAGNTA